MHGSYKLVADCFEIYPILFKICEWIQHAQHNLAEYSTC